MVKNKYPADIKISSKLSDMKPRHASWIVDFYTHIQGESEIVIKGFKEAGIVEAINDAQDRPAQTFSLRRTHEYSIIFRIVLLK